MEKLQLFDLNSFDGIRDFGNNISHNYVLFQPIPKIF